MIRSIKCNACGNEIPIEEAFFQDEKEQFQLDIQQKKVAIQKAMEKLAQGREEIDLKIKEAREQYSAKLEKDREKIRSEVEEKMNRDFHNKIDILQREVDEKTKKIKNLQSWEYEVAKREEALEDEMRKFELKMKQKVDKEKQRLFEEAQQYVKDEFQTKMRFLEEEIAVKDKKIRKAEVVELELIKQKNEIEEKKRTLELEVVRKVEQKEKEIREKERERMLQENKVKDLEKDKQIQMMLKKIDNLQKSAVQKSQQFQGAVLQDNLLEILRNAFPLDNIERIPPGIKGADIIHDVIGGKRQECGRIVIESKNTKTWQDGWTLKLKHDGRKVKGDVYIIVTSTLPEDIKTFGFKNGVWVTNPDSFINLVHVIRAFIFKLHIKMVASTGQSKKAEALYKYLCGTEYRDHIEEITETLSIMTAGLNSEKNVITKIWGEREKHIDFIRNNIAMFYGEIQGIIGKEVKEVRPFQLLSLETNNIKQPVNQIMQ